MGIEGLEGRGEGCFWFLVELLFFLFEFALLMYHSRFAISIYDYS